MQLLFISFLGFGLCLSLFLSGNRHTLFPPLALGQMGLLPPSGNVDFIKSSMEAAGYGHGQKEVLSLNQSPMGWDLTLHLLSIPKWYPEQKCVGTFNRPDWLARVCRFESFLNH